MHALDSMPWELQMTIYHHYKIEHFFLMETVGFLKSNICRVV